ncbi:MAG TPA: MAPEG family protein [Polyangiaceae bacterium]|nr:MAPEG family protein [Polyangiaceae bacterium]
MTVPFWCLFAGVLLPYLWSTLSFRERKERFGDIDLKTPRVQASQLSGSGARAMGAHANAFEALIVFAPAVLVAHLASADPTWAARLAIVWVVARLAHGAAYLADMQPVRSLAFMVGFACAIGLFVLSAL